MKTCEIRFIDMKLREAYHKLEHGSNEEQELYQRIKKATQVLESNPEAGIRIKKKLIPKAYIKVNHINNLWKYNLGGKWRLLYTLTGDEIRIVTIILEWLSHKHYERRFRYS